MAIQEIGKTINLSLGTYVNTVYKDNKLQLVEVTKDLEGRSVYVQSGYWESDAILIEDKVASFKNIARTVSVVGSASYKVYLKTSPDGFTWTSYVEVNADGSINNSPDKYAKIKVEIQANRLTSSFYLDDFSQAGKYSNEFLNTESGYLELKKIYQGEMVSDGSTVFTKVIPNTKYKKIDNIQVTIVEE